MRKLKRNPVQFATSGESLTHQSERTRADINNLVKRGIVPPDPAQLHFRDFSDGADFQAVQDSIVQVRESFDSLSSDIRDRFKNDPAKLIDFVNNPQNAAEAADMGLLIVDDSTPDIKPQDSDSVPPSQPSKEADLTT